MPLPSGQRHFFAKKCLKQVTGLFEAFFRNIYEGKMKKCISLLAVSEYQRVIKKIRGKLLNLY